MSGALPSTVDRVEPVEPLANATAGMTTFVVTNTNDSGPGSLRQAILDANDNPGPDQIDFDLGGGVPSIAVGGGALPSVTDAVTIDGGVGGASLVELNGAAAGAGADGLTIAAGTVVLRRLVLNRFAGSGIRVASGGRCTVESCTIGTDASGTADLGNGTGIRIESSGSTIGGNTGAVSNVIAFNDTGIVVSAGDPIPFGNRIGRNSIYNNGTGIDLGDNGVTPNDPLDVDHGPNGLVNFPIIDSASTSGFFTDVHVMLEAAPNTDNVVTVFSSSVCGQNGHGEGRTWIGTLDVTTARNGTAIFQVALVAVVPSGHVVTAHATDPAGNTSEFSACVAVNAGLDTVGVHVASSASWFLKNSNEPGPASVVYGYGPPGSGWTPISGDWDGDGDDTPGLYNPANGFFFLKNTNAAGSADVVFGFGPGGLGWQPIAGDWNGDGVDTVGLYAPDTGYFFLKNANMSGSADLVYGFGPAGLSWLAVAGDWNIDGIDTVGLYNRTNGFFFLRNAHAAGAADAVFGFGPGGQTWVPLAGDYDHNGSDTVGLYDPSAGTFFLRYANAAGPADLVVPYGPVGPEVRPLMGNWDGN